MKTSGAAWQDTHVSGVMDGGVRGPLDRHRLRPAPNAESPLSLCKRPRCSASSSPVLGHNRERLPGRAGSVRSGFCPRVLPGGECGVGLGLRPGAVYFGVFRRPLSEKKIAAPSPSFPLCPSFQKLLRATQQKCTGSVALPPSPPPSSARAWPPAAAVARARGTVREVRARAAFACVGEWGAVRSPNGQGSPPPERLPPRVAQAHSDNLAFLEGGGMGGGDGCRPFRAPAQSDRVRFQVAYWRKAKQSPGTGIVSRHPAFSPTLSRAMFERFPVDWVTPEARVSPDRSSSGALVGRVCRRGRRLLALR